MRERIATLNQIDPYVGRYFSAEWVKKKVLMMTDDEIEEMDKQIEEEGPREDEQQDQQVQSNQQDDSQQSEPVDNTVDRTEQESSTPDLDSRLQKYT